MKTMMKKMVVWAWAGCAAAAAWAETAAEEAVPGAVVYQGVLSDPVSGPLTGAQQASIRVFTDAAGGDPAWSKDVEVWCGADGSFHAWLEGGDELMEAFAEPPEPQRFLEMQVQGHGAAIAPRVEFTSAPQALLARWARRSPLAFPVLGALSAGDAVAVADAAKFVAGASFGDLAVEGGAELADADSPAGVSGTVEAPRFEGDGIPPVGSIAMWMDKDNPPDGWALCNGQTVNGMTTPDLTDRFPVGAGGDDDEFHYEVGDTGGTNSVALTVAQIPSHTHDYTTASTRDYHPVPWMGWMSGDWWQNSTGGSPDDATTDSAGNGAAHENRPPYLAVCFIMRVR